MASQTEKVRSLARQDAESRSKPAKNKNWRPSHTRPNRPFNVPPGALTAWMVSGINLVTPNRFVNSKRLGVFLDEKIAYAFADEMYMSNEYRLVKVDRKAVIRLNDGKIYMMYVAPVVVASDKTDTTLSVMVAAAMAVARTPDNFKPRPGAYRVCRNGVWTCANPGDPLYSTLTLIGTEFWDGHKWTTILDEESDNART